MTKIYRYPGSRPFTTEDRNLFFGRDNDIAELSKFINVEKLVVLYGRSGLGKSSVINAGVLPKLETEGTFIPLPIRLNSYAEINQAISITGKTPFDIFKDKLGAVIEEYYTRQHILYDEDADFLKKIENTNISIWQQLKSLQLVTRNPENKKVILLVFDQFEELFTYPEGIDAYSEVISELLNQIIPREFRRTLKKKLYETSDLLTDEQLYLLDELLEVKVLFSIRSDKLNLLNRLTNEIPTILRNCYELLPLTREKATTAIIRPARKRDDNYLSQPFHYSPEALDKILDYLTQDDTKDIESFQLQILCQHVEENIVVPKGDDFIEGDDIGDLKAIYQNYYDIQIAKLKTETDRQKARILIEDGLIFDEEERRVSLYEGQIIKSYNISTSLLQELVDTHLLRSEPSPQGGFTYELSHDSLVAPILKSKTRRKAEENFIIKQKETQEKLEIEQKERKIMTKRVFWGIGALVIILIIISFFGLRTYFSEMRIKNELDANKIATIALQKEKDDPTMALSIVKRGERDFTQTFSLLLVRNEILTKNIFYTSVFKSGRVKMNAVAIHPGNQYVLTANRNGKISIYNVEGDSIATLEHGKETIHALFSPNGKYLISSSINDIKLWEFDSDKKTAVLSDAKFKGLQSNINTIVFSPDGKNIVAAGDSKKIIFWDLEGNVQKTIEGRWNGATTSISFSPKNDYLVLGTKEGEVALLNLNGRDKDNIIFVGEESQKKTAHEPGTVEVAFSSNGKNFLSYNSESEEDKILQVWDLKGKRVNRINYTSPINMAIFSPSNDTIYTACKNGKIILWDAKTKNKRIQELKGHTDDVTSIACSSNGKYVLTGSGPLGNDDRGALLWDMKAQHKSSFLMNEGNEGLQSVALSPDGTQMLSIDASNILNLWNVGNNSVKLVSTLEKSDTPIDMIQFSINGKQAIMANRKTGNITVWELDKRSKKIIKVEENEIKAVSLTHNGDSILVSNGTSLIAYSTDGQKKEYRYLEEKGVVSMAFSPDGKFLVLGKDDNKLVMYILVNQKPIKREILGIHNDPITSIAFSPDGKFILTGSEDKTVKVWDNKGRELQSINTGMGVIRSVAFITDPEEKNTQNYIAVDDKGIVTLFSNLKSFVEDIASIYDDSFRRKNRTPRLKNIKEDVIKKTIEEESNKYKLNE